MVGDDIESLSAEDRVDFMYWKAWRAAKLSEQPAEPVSEQEYCYYTVYFTIRSKGTFSIERVIKRTDEAITMKFLERVGDRTKFIFDWPKRDDIELVTENFILTKVLFKWPPPFEFKSEQLTAIMSRVREFHYK